MPTNYTCKNCGEHQDIPWAKLAETPCVCDEHTRCATHEAIGRKLCLECLWHELQAH